MVNRLRYHLLLEAHSSVCGIQTTTIKVEPTKDRRIGSASIVIFSPEALQAQLCPRSLVKMDALCKDQDELVARGPSVIILDNIHLSDSGTIELMGGYLIQNTLSEKTRPDFVSHRHSQMWTPLKSTES